MMQFHSEAARRLNDELDRLVGHVEDGQGRKIYGHKRLATKRRDLVLAGLRGAAIAEPTIILHAQELRPQRTIPRRQKSAAHRAVERRFRTTPPSAAQAGLIGRAACIAVALIAIAVTALVDVSLSAAIAALPLPKLIGAALARGV